jgi:hypothetical protein
MVKLFVGGAHVIFTLFVFASYVDVQNKQDVARYVVLRIPPLIIVRVTETGPVIFVTVSIPKNNGL